MQRRVEGLEVLGKRLSRRRLLEAGAAAGLAGAALAACGGDEKEEEPVATATAQRREISGPSVETLTGPISTGEMGFTLMHEHIFSRSEGVQFQFPFLWDQQTEVDRAVETLTRLKAKGVDTILDPTVLGLGRDVPLLIPIAEKAGINVIPATGLYTYDELPHYFASRSVEHMADVFVREIEEGIQGTSVRAAVIKCATDQPGVTPGVEKVLRAAAQAHLRTGAPITTHTHARTERGLEQQDIFESEGVDLSRVIIGHSGDTDDLGYLTKLLDRGSYIGMDRFGLEVYLSTEKRVATIAELCKLGYTERMVLSHDAMVYFDWFPPEALPALGPDWNYFHIIDNVIPMLLEAGVTEVQIDTMTRENPRRIFENVQPY
ncbi:MAG: phosphotriesterase-related protein [Dehalococcoidia bacterium]|nr:phosphotriesterase-related protein [Dehalococcoidia bacterium]